jgi:hypothetical protein
MVPTDAHKYNEISLYRQVLFYATFQIYAIIFSLTQFGIDEPGPHLSSVGGYHKVTSLSRHQSHVWILYIGDIITRLI